MQFAGFQELSLLDFPGVLSSIVFTQGCPFRCPYCHNPELIPLTRNTEGYSEATILNYLKQHRQMIEGVCITGGEPTIHPELPTFISLLKRQGFLIKLDTNGIHPNMIQSLIDQKLLDYIAMDLKHSWENYNAIAGTSNTHIGETCKKTMKIIQTSGVRHEFRTTVYPGKQQLHDIATIASELKAQETYFLQQFRPGKTLSEQHPEMTGNEAEQWATQLQDQFPLLTISAR